jgi:hypothetical protein
VLAVYAGTSFVTVTRPSESHITNSSSSVFK